MIFLLEKKDIVDLTSLIQKPEECPSTLKKAIILLLYSHWEGFIKKSAAWYIYHVRLQEVYLEDLTQNHHVIEFKDRLKALKESSTSVSMSHEIELFKALKEAPKKVYIPDFFEISGNLDYDKFNSICKVLGLHDLNEVLATRKIQLDKKLLANRNAIAHGGYSKTVSPCRFDIMYKEIEELRELIFLLMDNFKENIEAYASNKFYLLINKDQKNTYDKEKLNKLEGAIKNIREKYK